MIESGSLVHIDEPSLYRIMWRLGAMTLMGLSSCSSRMLLPCCSPALCNEFVLRPPQHEVIPCKGMVKLRLVGSPKGGIEIIGFFGVPLLL